MKKILFVAIVMLSTTVMKAQEEKTAGKEKIYLKLKDGAKPSIYVNDKLFDFPLELIDQSKIASVNVLKDEQAIKKYKAPNGVIIITTKELKSAAPLEFKIDKNGNVIDNKNAPMIIMDGKVINKEQLDKIGTNLIDKMEVLKGEAAMKKYNAPNGVIIITTKKQ